MEKDISVHTVAPSPKVVRGYLSSIDVCQSHVLYFNGATVVLMPHDPTKPVLNIVHLTDISAVKFGPNGRLVASIEAKGTLIISQICPDKVLTVNQYDNFFPNAKSLDWSADGKRICAVGEGKASFGRVALVETGTNAGELTCVTGTLNSCCFRPQRPYKLVLGGDEMTLKFYDGPPYSFKQSDQSHKGFINQLKYSPKGTYILTGGADRKLTLHDGLKYQRIAEKENAHNGGIFGVDWIDQEHFVTCSSDKLIKVWNIKFQEKFVIEAGSSQDIKNPKKIELSLLGIRVYKDLIYAINLEGNILVYKNPLLSNTSTLIKTYSGARTKVTQIIPFSQNQLILLDSGGRMLIYSLFKHKVKALSSAVELKNISGGFIQGVSAAVKELFVLQQDGNTLIFKTESTAQELAFFKKLAKISLTNISSFQNELIVGTTTNSLVIYDSNKEETVKSVQITEDITSLQSNNHMIIVGTIKGKVLIFDENLVQIGKSQLATFRVSTIKLIPEHPPKERQSLVLIGDSCANMKLIHISPGSVEIIKDNMGGHSSLITSADSDEKWIYTFSMDGKVNIWNRTTYKRDNEMKDIVKGGILSGVSVKDRLVIAGGDLLVKVIPKLY